MIHVGRSQGFHEEEKYRDDLPFFFLCLLPVNCYYILCTTNVCYLYSRSYLEFIKHSHLHFWSLSAHRERKWQCGTERRDTDLALQGRIRDAISGAFRKHKIQAASTAGFRRWSSVTGKPELEFFRYLTPKDCNSSACPPVANQLKFSTFI